MRALLVLGMMCMGALAAAAPIRNQAAPLHTVAVQVPLASHAIQLLATGHAKDEEQIVADVSGVLATIEGESSWAGAGR